MDIDLINNNIKYAKAALTTLVTQEETMEMIVPDALPDILHIVDTDATVMLRGKEAEAGRVSISGIVSATVIYSPEGVPGVKKLDVNMPFNVVVSGGEITGSSKVAAVLSLSSIDSSMLNSRKINVHANILADVTCYNESELVIATGVDTDVDPCMETLCNTTEISTVSAIREKTFVVSDEFSIPAALPGLDEILKISVDFSIEDASAVGNKLIFRGECRVSLIYLPIGESGICTTEFKSEFSQIVELDEVSEEDIVDIKLMLTGQYFDLSMQDMENRTLVSELHLVAQCTIMSRFVAEYLADTYSTKYELSQETARESIEHRCGTFKVSDTLRDTIDIPANVKDVVSVNVHCGPAAAEIAGDTLNLNAMVLVSILYITENDQVLSVSCRREITASSECNGSHNYAASAAAGKDIYAAAAGSSIDLRVLVEFTVSETDIVEFTYIQSLSYDEDKVIDLSSRPSLVIHIAESTDTLWSLAKRFSSSTSLIYAANDLAEGDTISTGQQLIIPKRR